MDFQLSMNSSETAKVKMQVDSFNSALNQGREVKSELGRDDFLKILLTQLTHQDPTAPMEDKDFIAQMAQFSSLEQMTNMSQEFTKLSGMVAKGQAISLIGKTVEIAGIAGSIQGKVTGVSGGDFPQVRVNDKYYDYSQVESVIE